MKTKEKTYRIKYKYNGEWLLSGMIRERDCSEEKLRQYKEQYEYASYIETDEEY